MIEYTRQITDEEQKILENDLLDIKDWIDKAIEGKISSCKKRAAKAYEAFAIKENISSIPTKDEDKCAAYFGNAKYKNRKQRDEE